MSDWQRQIAQQGVIVVLVLGVILTGHKRFWYFAHVVDSLLASKDKEIASSAKVIEEKDRVLALVTQSFEQRLAEKEEECERERKRSAKSEEYTDRLIRSAISATEIATTAAKAVKRE